MVKVKVLFPVIILISSFIALGIVLINKKNTHCLALHSGDVIVHVQYPDEFIDVSYKERIRFVKNKDMGEEFVLGIDSTDHYESIDELINISTLESGPRYKKTKFNGYDAAVIINESLNPLNDYKILFKKTEFYLFYNFGIRRRQSGHFKTKLFH